MRYTLSELATLPVVGKFTTGDTVTIKVYDVATDTELTLTDDSCDPLTDDTSFFEWNFSNLDLQPTTFKRLLWVMTNGTVEQSSIIDVAGWAERVDPLGPADTCKITVNLYDGDGIATINPNDLFDVNKENHIEIKAPYFQTDRYFKFGKYQPSYDALTAQAFWILPQGATVDIKLSLFGVASTAIVVPSQSTITLNDWLNL